MSDTGRGHFDGQRWWNQLIATRTNAALAHLPPEERKLRYGAERKKQEALYRKERDEKKRAKIQRNKERQRVNLERQRQKEEHLTEKAQPEQPATPLESITDAE